MASTALNPATHTAPLARLVGNSWAAKISAILIGSILLALSAKVIFPMYPVSMTMQSYAVLLLAAVGGRTIGLGAILAYLVEGAAGLPIFTTGGGLAAFVGPTGGFLVGFALTGWFIAEAVERGYAKSILGSVVVLTVGHLVMFVPGVAWLATIVGFEKAIAGGLVPFIPGTIVKTGLAIASLWAANRAMKKA